MSAHLVETHVSTLFFLGERVYKLKKPVTLGFLDFSTREAREEACRREVELNRRLAPDVYLGVATVNGPDGKPCDHLVVMRRMPDQLRLAELVRRGADVSDDLRSLARLLAAFHEAAPGGPAVAEAATADAVLRNWENNVEEIARFAGPVLDPHQFEQVAALARRYVLGRRPLFDHRIAAGWVRDGHGDLLAEDIFCLPDGPRVLDCIEFDDRLRYGDVLADVAFLAMDLERLGRPDLGARFLAWYGEFTGERHPTTLADHYVAYRAHIRAKVACLRYEQGDRPSGEEARRLHAMARRHLEQAQVALVLVGGLPGTGKSTLAALLGDARGWAVLRSDAVRKELAGLGPAQPAAAPFGEGIYTPEMTARTYDELLARARHLLERGESVVVDASWSAAAHRAAARTLAGATHSVLVELRCEAPSDVAAQRMAARAAAGSDPSDATPEVAIGLAAQTDPWPEAVTVDGTTEPGVMRDAALAAVDRRIRAASRCG